MPDGLPPALIAERFDIRRTSRDQRLLALEDFCSVLDLPASAKYDGTVERMGMALRASLRRRKHARLSEARDRRRALKLNGKDNRLTAAEAKSQRLVNVGG